MNNPFESNENPTPEMIEAMNTTRALAFELYAHYQTLPPSRERSLAMTVLKESAMWASKAVTQASPSAPVPIPYINSLKGITVNGRDVAWQGEITYAKVVELAGKKASHQWCSTQKKMTSL